MRLTSTFAIIFLLVFLSCSETETKADLSIVQSSQEQVFTNLELTSHVYLTCLINDSIKGEFLFDSGANGLILDESFLVKNNLEDSIIQSKNGHTYGVGLNRTKHKSITDISISIDNQKFSDLELRVMPLDSIFSSILNHKIDGIVGYDIFDEYLIKMNFDKSTFKLIDSISPSEEKEYVKLTYTDKYRKPIIKTTIIQENKERIECRLIFDMGSGRGISLTKNKGLKENLFSDNLACERDSIAGMGGESESCYLAVDSIKFVDIKMEVDSIEIGNDEKGALGMHNMYDGMLGMRIIDHFNVVINPHGKEIWLQERKPEKNSQ